MLLNILKLFVQIIYKNNFLKLNKNIKYYMSLTLICSNNSSSLFKMKF